MRSQAWKNGAVGDVPVFGVEPPHMPHRRPLETGRVQHALTLHQPWGAAILRGPKRVENRGWVLRGPFPRWIAVHYGQKHDKQGAAFCAEHWQGAPEGALDAKPSGIYGAMRVSGVRAEGELGHADDPWFFGPYGLQIDAVVMLDEPVLCKGAQGLWRISEAAQEALGALTPDATLRADLRALYADLVQGLPGGTFIIEVPRGRGVEPVTFTPERVERTLGWMRFDGTPPDVRAWVEAQRQEEGEYTGAEQDAFLAMGGHALSPRLLVECLVTVLAWRCGKDHLGKTPRQRHAPYTFDLPHGMALAYGECGGFDRLRWVRAALEESEEVQAATSRLAAAQGLLLRREGYRIELTREAEEAEEHLAEVRHAVIAEAVEGFEVSRRVPAPLFVEDAGWTTVWW